MKKKQLVIFKLPLLNKNFSMNIFQPIFFQTEPEPSNTEKINTENNDIMSVCVLKPVPAPALVVQLPPTDMQLIIDKMASYVAKNGRDFENVVKNKGPNFSPFSSKQATTSQ